MKHQPIETFGISGRHADAGLAKMGDSGTAPTIVYFGVKRAFDIVMCLLLLSVMLITAVILTVLNPSKNNGPLFFVQTRMGRNCEPFQAIKFRSMTVVDKIERGANDPLETDRITRLGNFLRRSRLDEVPQIINVLKGDMSLVGPRPDYIVHAEEFVDVIPGYKERHAVRPGISGYAQTEVGYVESFDATRKKVSADLHYIANRSIALEAWVVWRTIQTVVGRNGA